MIQKPKSTQEKRAVQFAVDLLTKYGYGYTINVPSRALAQELTSMGKKLSFMSVIAYWKILEKMKYAKKESPKARILGVTYTLNRYAFGKILNGMKL